VARSDKGRNRVAWVDVPCSAGCGRRVRRRLGEMRRRNFCDRSCYAAWLRNVMEWLDRWEDENGPLDFSESNHVNP